MFCIMRPYFEQPVEELFFVPLQFYDLPRYGVFNRTMGRKLCALRLSAAGPD